MATPIFGLEHVTTLELALQWAESRGAHPRYKEILPLYFALAPIYDIPPQNGIGQSAKETGYWHYTGVVPHTHKNLCGLKTATGTSNTDPAHHQVFESWLQAAHAHLQHLTRYGGRPLPPGVELVDPRWHLVTKQTDTIEGLGGAWAPSPSYGTETAKVIASIPLSTGALPGTPKLFGAYNHIPRIDRSMVLSWSQIAALPNFPGDRLRQFRYVTGHETGNPKAGANALMHRNFVANGGGSARVSFQWTTDGVGPLGHIIQIAPVDAACWHAGDGNGPGNRESNACEMCINVDGDFNLMLYNTAYLFADLQVVHGVRHEDKVQHNHWSGKNCPATLRQTGKWNWFLEGVIQWEEYLMSASERRFDTVPYVLSGEIKRYWEMLESMRVPGTQHSLVWLVLGYPQENATTRDVTYDDGETKTRLTQVCEYGMIVVEPEMAPPYNVRHLMLRLFDSIPSGDSELPAVVRERAGVISSHQAEIVERIAAAREDLTRINELAKADRELAKKIEAGAD